MSQGLCARWMCESPLRNVSRQTFCANSQGVILSEGEINHWKASWCSGYVVYCIILIIINSHGLGWCEVQVTSKAKNKNNFWVSRVLLEH